MWKVNFNSETKVWSGPNLPSLFGSQLSVGQLVLWLLDRNPSKIAQVCILKPEGFFIIYNIQNH